MTRQRNTPSDLEFFEARVFRPEAPCWNWRAYVGKNGYGKWVRSDRQGVAHRIAYELLVGPIPEGLQLHHLCFNRSCVNPEHLVPVTAKENKEMGSAAVSNRAKTHCPKGHPLDGVRTNGKHRYCKTCTREYDERRRQDAPSYGRLDRECKNGHPRTPENTVVLPSGTKRCRLCRNEGARKPGGYKDPERERATHCPHGHEWTPENTYEYVRDDRPYRYCRECNRAAARRRQPPEPKMRSETLPPSR